MTACTDSPLTITGNILSILTFFLGLIASYLTFYTLTLSATSEIHTFKSDIEITKKQLRSAVECVGEESCLAPLPRFDGDGTFKKGLDALNSLLQSLWEDLESLQREHIDGYREGLRRENGAENADGYSKRREQLEEGIARERKGRWKWWQEEVWKRVRWIGKRKEISRRMERIAWLKMDVSVGEMNLLLRKMAAQVHVMSERFERSDGVDEVDG
ncbi:uncharacterized protein PAC_09932 [Phialocephala subalpina]|uniref:Uncharacterized protein n=1 Tax=Phialocephala subalpina TaxID=576137 RepID=A0A1L7X4W0_9HELO|nr:uncharacterized protein PAC_09932 [Phialocephala subalpina]